MSDKIRARFWAPQIEGLLNEIAREAYIADVKLLNPGVIEAVLHNDAAAAGSTNPLAFKKLRDLLMMGFVVREKAMERLGVEEIAEMVTEIRAHLKERYEGKLGGTPGQT